MSLFGFKVVSPSKDPVIQRNRRRRMIAKLTIHRINREHDRLLGHLRCHLCDVSFRPCDEKEHLKTREHLYRFINFFFNN